MNQVEIGKTVFVMGAGFTKAFCPTAPLLEDDYLGQMLMDHFGWYPRAKSMVQAELDLTGGKINLERLMSRLYGGMPYDPYLGDETELRFLLSQVEEVFRTRLKEGTSSDERVTEALANLARHCVERVYCPT